jgi:hypothetical protein
MIRGMSYPKGIFYMNKEYIAHASIGRDRTIQTDLFPVGTAGLLFFIKRTLFSTPWYFLLIVTALAGWIILIRPDFPFFFLLIALFGYHFIFPYPLRQYHGAEHKIFSYSGEKTLEALAQIETASIVNRNCSTNSAVYFFLLFLLTYYPLGGNVASIVAISGMILIPRFLPVGDEKIIFPISAFFQKHVTTAEPDAKHLKVALLSYLTLIREEKVTEAGLQEEFARKRAEHRRLREEEAKKRLEQESLQRIMETEWLEI